MCCGLEVESISHVLFECEVTNEAWSNSKYKEEVLAAPDGPFSLKLLWWVNNLRLEEVREIMTIAWALWFCRNKYVYAQESLNNQAMAKSFLRLVDDYNIYAARVYAPVRPQNDPSISAASWAKPQTGVIKVNVDAHIVTGEYTSLGVVLRDANGVVQMMATKIMVGSREPSLAEAEAVRYGIQVARRAGYDKVWVESDAQTVVRSVQSKEYGLAPIYLIYEDIRNLAKSFIYFHFSHVKRAGNTVAHLVARWDTRSSDELVCMFPIPQSIMTLAELDLQ